jgi:hypothetical protein
LKNAVGTDLIFPPLFFLSLQQSLETIDADMLSKGSDLGALQEMQKKRDVAAGKIDELMAEWEELEELLA